MISRFFIIGLFCSINSLGFTITNQTGWENTNLAINLNPTNCPADILERLDDAFKLWNSVATSSLKLSLGNVTSTTTGAQIRAGQATDAPVVTCDPNMGTTFNEDDNFILGVGTAWSTNNGYLNQGGVVLNVRSGSRANINATDVATRNVVVAHELGHMLGVGHSSSESALMYYSAGSRNTVNLSKDDWDAISYLYPRDEVAKSNLAGGCGLVKNQPPNFPRGIWTLLLMLLPLVYYRVLRSKNYISK